MPHHHPHPSNVGILSLEIYFPKLHVSQADLERYNGVSTGKYTIGLGQTGIAFASDREDIYSLSLSTLSRLFATHTVHPSTLGRLEVGTETLIDKSKSVKSVLMMLMGGNETVEGVDVKNACYGGTAALFNSVQWVESSAWDGRNACVVAADIAVYARGPARPTGGMGGVAMTIGPDAPLVMEHARGVHMEHAYDFYKPDLSTVFPYVDGPLTVEGYLRGGDKCYTRYLDRLASLEPQVHADVDVFDYIVFHVPYAKLIQKSVGRLMFNDLKRHPTSPKYASVQQYKDVAHEASYHDKELERAFVQLSKPVFASKVEPSLYAAKLCGNMYCASVYASLISLLSSVPAQELQGKRIGVFSYGSGLTATMFSLRVRDAEATVAMAARINLKQRLADRKLCTPAEFEDVMELREKTHQLCNYSPCGDVQDIQQDAYYLEYVDAKFRRQYKQNGQAAKKTAVY